MAIQWKGFLSFKEEGSRLVTRHDGKLVSRDLGRISYEEARKKAWLNAVPLVTAGRIMSRAA